jgi:hypothetical protein
MKVRTLVCKDGVVGLNGYQYLLDSENNEMEFQTQSEAVEFLTNNGCSKDWVSENVEFEN